jgi:hypothetical protein
MKRKSKHPTPRIPDVGYRRRHSASPRNLEEPIEESPETLERAVGIGQRIGSEKPEKRRHYLGG